MIIKLNESSAKTDLKKTLSTVSNFINKSYGNNISAEVNDAGDTISFGDITKSTALDKVRVIIKNEPVFYIEGPLGDTEYKALSLDSLQNKLIDIIMNTTRNSRTLDESNEDNVLEDYDDEDEDEEDFYEDPSELFDSDYSNVIGLMSDMLDELDITDTNEKALHNKIVKFLKHPEQHDEIKQMSVDAVNDSDTIWDYISEYSCAELGEMDGIWNEFGDILRGVIYKYFGFSEEL